MKNFRLLPGALALLAVAPGHAQISMTSRPQQLEPQPGHFVLDQSTQEIADFLRAAIRAQSGITLTQYKLNTFRRHLTEDQGWRIEIKRYPKLTEVGA